MKPNIPGLIELTPEEYARRRAKREATGFADDERERRKPLEPEKRNRKPTNVTLSPDALAIAKRCGYGIISRGIEHALHEWLERHPDKRKKRAKRRVDVRHMNPGPRMRPLIAARKRKRKHLFG